VVFFFLMLSALINIKKFGELKSISIFVAIRRHLTRFYSKSRLLPRI